MSDPAVRTRAARWLRFNAVGLAGVIVQLGVLALLTRIAGWHYLPATIVAVELTLLHNLVWHERWTWRDRPAASTAARVVRGARFHAVNGGVSLAGNAGLMWLLAGRLGLDPLLANLVAVGVCSLLNFLGSDRLVFRPLDAKPSGHAPTRASRPGRTAVATVAAVVLALLPLRAAHEGGPVRPATVAAWDAYERQVDARYGREVSQPFFASDALGGAATWRNEAIAGRVPMFQARRAAPGAAEPEVPDGRIHHWVGATFVKGLTVAQVIASLQAHAGRESQSYEDVIASRLLSRDGDRVNVFLKLRRTKVITATYNTEHHVEYRRLGEARGSSRSVSTRIVELADAGTPVEREKTADEDSGYLWRLNAYWRYEQTADGVLIECESVSLSRAVPALLRPFISGIVEGVARDSLERTLTSLGKTLTTSPR
ncbi:MAG: GtrA family protein [Vicinamibacterales bacterium]